MLVTMFVSEATIYGSLWKAANTGLSQKATRLYQFQEGYLGIFGIFFSLYYSCKKNKNTFYSCGPQCVIANAN